MIPPPPTSTLFPCMTLFRSPVLVEHRESQASDLLGPPHVGDDGLGAVAAGGDGGDAVLGPLVVDLGEDRKSTRLNASHVRIAYAVFCLKKKKSPRMYKQFKS